MWEVNRYSLLAFGVLLTDQVFDLLVEALLPLGASLLLVGGWFDITRFDGPSGGALDTNGFFLLLALVVIPIFMRFKMRPPSDALYGVGISLLMGGLLGNLADGLRLNFPIDYLVVGGSAFNIADVALLVGVSLLLYRLRSQKESRAGNL